MNVYLTNAFSLNMLAPWRLVEHDVGFEPTDEPGPGATILVKPITKEQAKYLLQEFGFTSAVGHESTAAVFAAELGLDVQAQRVTVAINNEDLAIVGQYSGPRLEEGATVLPDGATIRWMAVSVDDVANISDDYAGYFSDKEDAQFSFREKKVE